VDDLIGSGSNDARFVAFLADWRAILVGRVDQVRDELMAIYGLSAVVLAGSHGRSAPWPLSDIDLILIARQGSEEAVRATVSRVGDRLTGEWAEAGWWTGLDAGNLLFSVGEIDAGLADGVAPLALLGEPRWFHTMDKAFGGRVLLEDADRRAGRLAAWATSSRFDGRVIDERTRRLGDELETAIELGRRASRDGDWVRATLALWRAIQLTQIALMNGWGHRDDSLGRFGTRFAIAAAENGQPALPVRLDALMDLDPDSLCRRFRRAPDWVRLRHDRSYRARLAIGENIDRLSDRRDTIRVSARYDAARHDGPTFPEWLGIVTDQHDLNRRLDEIMAVVELSNRTRHPTSRKSRTSWSNG